jgi:hypothetical protein
MTLAGIWESAVEPLAVHIDGTGPSYAFRCFLSGNFVSQGTAAPNGPNSYLLTGQGVLGPVKMTMALQGADQVLVTTFLATGVPLVDNLLAVPQGQGLLFRKPLVQQAAPALPSRAEPQPEEEPAPKKVAVARPKRKPADDGRNPLDALDEMVGMAAVKEQLRKLDAWAWRQQELKRKGVDVTAPSLHMSFAGNPGTGKTTVAKMVGRLLHRYGLIDRDEVTEKARADLVGKFIGHTADQTKKAIEDAVGGVLFIDEAYALSEPAKGSPQDYGSEALTVLVAEMENRRHELCVIVAGYPQEMETFLDVNPGLAARISRRIVFPDFSNDELCAVFEQMVRTHGLTREEGIVPLLARYVDAAQKKLPPRRWGNARSIRNIIEAGVENQAVRLRARHGSASKDELLRLTVKDFDFLKDERVSVY